MLLEHAKRRDNLGVVMDAASGLYRKGSARRRVGMLHSYRVSRFHCFVISKFFAGGGAIQVCGIEKWVIGGLRGALYGCSLKKCGRKLAWLAWLAHRRSELTGQTLFQTCDSKVK